MQDLNIAKLSKNSRNWGLNLTVRRPGSHEIWFNPITNKYTTIPSHPGDMPEGTLKAILRQADIMTDQFLNT
ncbi:type II toxin-antitoxin system HicA family toxin [Methyloprofundus sp.]|uniref:type II toxin-antitoxin system HicA family toxin n=1 Tax=Methyloprofundus sp. TaxID=2020875 RepID=UPI003D0AFAB8